MSPGSFKTCQQYRQQPVSGEARASGRGDPLLQQLLPGVLPDQQRPTHMDVEGADDALLRNLHAHVQLLDQIRWNPFTFVADEEKWKRKVSFLVKKQFFFLDILDITGRDRLTK